MKYFLILLIIFQSCNNKKQEETSSIDSESEYKIIAKGNVDVFIISNISKSAYDSTTIYLEQIKKSYLNLADSAVNYTDSISQKQGSWLYYFGKRKEVLSEICNYKNNKVNGLRIKYESGEQDIKTQIFVNGKQHGFERWYRNFGEKNKIDKWVLIWIGYYENDTLLWGQKPYHNGYEGYFLSNWIFTKYDSLFVEFYYENNNKWYNGLFIKNKPIGIHNTYYASGILRTSTNFETSEIKTYNRQGILTTIKKGEITERELQNGKEEHYGTNGILIETWLYKDFDVIKKIQN